MAKACLQCGGPCKKDIRTFCSQKCRGVHRSLNTVKRVRQCETCNEPCKTVYRRFCSSKCRANSPEARALHAEVHVGRKQSAEQIANRIAKTDQTAKEAKRKATMIERFGVDNYAHTTAHKAHTRELATGRVIPRTVEHQTKIINAKRRNGTLAHSAETRKKFARIVNERYADPSYDRSVHVTKVFNSFTGHYRGLYYRSSYEQMFLRFCRKYFIDVESAGIKKYAVPYVDQYGSERMYYPDFYLPEFDLIIEIKPSTMLKYGSNPRKFAAANRRYPRFCVLTELSGYTDKTKWHDLYYGQIMEWCGEYLCHGS